ncbi:CTD nuclear envelope phosphatase 1, partial [Eudyptes schlegeli]
RQVIQYQTVRYDVLPLSPVSRNRLNQVKRKILVLDLDETLIHSHHDGVLRPTVRPGTPPDFILKVGGGAWVGVPRGRTWGSWGQTLGVPGAGGGSSGSWSLRWGGHCTLELGSYIKDLSVVHSDLSSIVILDNSPGAYRSHPGTA